MESEQLDEKIKKTVKDFAEKLSQGLGGNLISVILYGSFAGGEHTRRYPDINILIVLGKVNVESLHIIAKISRSPKFKDIAPLTLGRAYLENSTDTFPVEFLDMQERHLVVWGEDCLKGLKIDLANLIHQCEWELKSKIINMQQFYINCQGRDRALKDFLLKGLPSFMVVFKNILRLKNIAEDKKDKILERLALEFNLEPDILERLLSARFGNGKIADAKDAFGRFLLTLQRLSEKIDKLTT